MLRSRSVRILQVCAVDFTAFHFLRPLMEACRAEGWEVEFACADGPGAARLRQLGFRFQSVPMTRAGSPVRLIRAALILALALRRSRPEVVHTHTPAGGIVGRAAATFARVPAVVHTFHGLPFESDRLSQTEFAYLQLERLIARWTDAFFSQAAGDAARAVALGIAGADKMTVIGNGVDTSRFAPSAHARAAVRSELGIPPDAVVALTTSRLVREKGLLELAEAAIALRDQTSLYFVLAGTALPSDRTSIEHELNEHKAPVMLGDRWKLLGYRGDPERLAAAADIFVLPTYREGLPRSIIEAMASGLPVVATDIAACRELVEEGLTGILVPVRDPDATANAISALAADQELRSRMGHRARAIAISDHDERTVIERQLAILRRFARP